MNNWQLLSSKQALVARANLYKNIRNFFEAKQVIEVETPLLSYASITDPNIHSFEVQNKIDNKKLYLQTSPEFAMKRLLCSNLGSSIYQICKAFRAEELGRNHHIEFSILEWYRLDFNLDNLINEVIELLCSLLKLENSKHNIIRYSYKEIFFEYLSFDYSLVDNQYLIKLIQKHYQNNFDNILNNPEFDKLYTNDDLLTILLSNYIEPKLPKDKIIILYDYPYTQAALAKIVNKDNLKVAKRFEVYYNGLELANGFEELSDSQEQLKRFEQDNIRRVELGLDKINIDYNLIDALKSGLPNCSGVAMGLDRILMLMLGVSKIDDVLSFRF